MTSTVRIEAHCADDKEVKITIINYDGDNFIFRLQDGEVYNTVIYDHRSIACEELLKGDE